MKNWKFSAFISLFFIAGYFVYLRKYYPFGDALLLALITVGLIYLIPLALIKAILNRNSLLLWGVLVATLWEFGMATITRATSFPAWESFMLAGVGGAITALLLAFVMPGKEKRNKSPEP